MEEIVKILDSSHTNATVSKGSQDHYAIWNKKVVISSEFNDKPT